MCVDTVLAHLKANKLGRFADVPTTLAHPPPPPVSAPSSIAPGARCEVAAGEGGMARVGNVRFVGEAQIARGGVWVGVELDEPVGKGDGQYVQSFLSLQTGICHANADIMHRVESRGIDTLLVRQNMPCLYDLTRLRLAIIRKMISWLTMVMKYNECI